jgi:hypothetical protein
MRRSSSESARCRRAGNSFGYFRAIGIGDRVLVHERHPTRPNESVHEDVYEQDSRTDLDVLDLPHANPPLQRTDK